MTTISVIIPAFNEEATIIEILKQVRAQSIEGFDLEVIVVDDGSQDSTPTLLREQPDLYDWLVTQTPNQGKGAAVIEARFGQSSPAETLNLQQCF